MDEDRRRQQSERRVTPERAKAIDRLAESQVKVGAAISDLGTALDYVVTLLRIGLLLVSIYAVLATAALSWGIYQGYRSSNERARLNRQTADIQQVTDEVHSAVTPGQPLYEKGQAAQAAVLSNLFIELDCRTRAALAHFPPIPAGQTCVALHPDFVPHG
jgi:hypothetical protein